jgi:hypothetical protein
MDVVTGQFLSQGRGWGSVENAYANVLQENLRFGGLELCHVQFPLFFVPQGHAIHRPIRVGLAHRARTLLSSRSSRSRRRDLGNAANSPRSSNRKNGAG